MVSNGDLKQYEEKINKCKKIIEKARSEYIGLQAEGKHLEQEKEQLLAEFQELGVTPDNIEDEMIKLKKDIAEKLSALEDLINNG